MSSSSVQVIVRLRPMNDVEKREGTLPVIKAQTQEKSVTVIKGQGSRQARSNFSFDNVFTAFSSQEEVFDSTLKSMIRDVMQGYESTVFAYGQTGTGKTYTMEGNLSSPEHYGIIPRSAQAIFELLKKPEYLTHHVVCTYLEIYNEELGDLFDDDTGGATSSTPVKERGRSSYASMTPVKDRNTPHNHHNAKKLEIMNGKSGTFCRGLKEREVRSAADVLKLMQRAQNYRKIGETKMNKESSRSHCVFSIIINANKRLSDGSTFEFSGKLHMVDLAGSECAKTATMDKSTGNEVARERERMNINRSLLTLGRVIKTLKDQSMSNKKGHVRIPYRDSKLTRILQDSLGGRCKTLIIATLSPSITAIEESMSTLNYAQAANGIINKPVSSSYLSLGASASSSIDSGSSESNGVTVEHWQAMECRLEYMQTQVEEAQAALARKHIQQQELVERAEKAERVMVELENKYFLSQEEVKKLNNDVKREQEEKQAISTLLQETELSLKKTSAILDATQHTEVCLTSEAKTILNSLDESIQDSNKMHQLLVKARDNDIRKRNATKKIHNETASKVDDVVKKLTELAKCTHSHHSTIKSETVNQKQLRDDTMSNLIQSLNETKHDILSLANSIDYIASDENGIKPALNDISNTTIDQIARTKSFISDGENELHNSINGLLTNMSDHSRDLNRRNEEYIQSSSDILSTLKSSITSTQQQITVMVSNTTKSLSDIRDANVQTKSDLLSLSNQIKSTSVEWSNSTNEILDVQRHQNNFTNEHLLKSKENLREIKAIVNNQNLSLDNEGGEHLQMVQTLEQKLMDQKVEFQQSYDIQKKLHGEVLQNMFTGMQNLMQGEMRRLEERALYDNNSSTTRCEVLLTCNEKIASSGDKMLKSAKDSNITLQRCVNSTEENNNLIENMSLEAKETITNLCKLTEDKHNMLSAHLDNTKLTCSSMDQQTESLYVTSERIESSNKEIGNYISDHTLHNLTNGLTKMNNLVQNNVNYSVESFIPDICQGLKSVEAPRSKVIEASSSSLNQIQQSLENTKLKIFDKIDEQSQKCRNIGDTIDSYELILHETTKSYCHNMQDKEKALGTELEIFDTSTTTSIKDCKSNLTGMKTSVRNFSLNDIQTEEKVPPLVSRPNVEYSSTLTSTPGEEIILKGLNLSIKDDDNDSMSVKSETSYVSSAGVSITQDSSPASDAPRMESKPLKELSVNRVNIDQTASTKNIQRTNSMSKKRPQSRQRDYKNRIPTTPRRGKSQKRRRERI